MNYAIMHYSKLKSSGFTANSKDIDVAYEHNLRIKEVINADSERNIEVLDDKLYGLTYHEEMERYLQEFQKDIDSPKVREDAVEGIEVMMTFSRDMQNQFSLEEWIKECMDWVDVNFNPPEHECIADNGEIIKTDNVRHAVLHLDEENPHIHVFAVPIDDRGHLNYSFYDDMEERQTSFAEAVKDFGLERGNYYSTGRQNLHQQYGKMVESLEISLPEPQIDENTLDYWVKSNIIYHDNQFLHKMEMDEISIAAQEHFQEHLAELEKISETEEKANEVLTSYLEPDESRDFIGKYKELDTPETLIKDSMGKQIYDEAEALYNQILLWQLERERSLSEPSR